MNYFKKYFGQNSKKKITYAKGFKKVKPKKIKTKKIKDKYVDYAENNAGNEENKGNEEQKETAPVEINEAQLLEIQQSISVLDIDPNEIRDLVIIGREANKSKFNEAYRRINIFTNEHGKYDRRRRGSRENLRELRESIQEDEIKKFIDDKEHLKKKVNEQKKFINDTKKLLEKKSTKKKEYKLM